MTAVTAVAAAASNSTRSGPGSPRPSSLARDRGVRPEGLFAQDVFADLTVPHWRVQAEGAERCSRSARTTTTRAG